MKYLLDAHTLIWAQDDPSKLGQSAINLLTHSTNQLFLSTATIWEISIKISLGKLTLATPFYEWIYRGVHDLELSILHITIAHADQQTRLPWHHRDPFDRLLTAQVLVEPMPLISNDTIFDMYGVPRIWF